MADRWKVSFPQVINPWTGRAVLVLGVEAIPMPGGARPTHGEAHCFERTGAVSRLIVSLAELDAAPRVHLLEANDVRAGCGAIVDFRGRVITAGGTDA